MVSSSHTHDTVFPHQSVYVRMCVHTTPHSMAVLLCPTISPAQCRCGVPPSPIAHLLLETPQLIWGQCVCLGYDRNDIHKFMQLLHEFHINGSQPTCTHASGEEGGGALTARTCRQNITCPTRNGICTHKQVSHPCDIPPSESCESYHVVLV